MGERMRALVVDDDETIRMMLAKIVERLEFEVDTARDGREAIEKIDREGYEVILLDLMMPQVDGYEVLRHMQSSDGDSLSRTIVASAVPKSEILREVSVPVYKIHTKPFDLDALMKDIQTCAMR